MVANTAKVGITSAERDAIAANTAKHSVELLFDVHTGWNGQSVDSSGNHIVDFSTEESPTSAFDLTANDYVISQSGNYYLMTTLSYGNGNDVGDGVILTFCVNGVMTGEMRRVVEPGKALTTQVATISGSLTLSQGDRISVCLQGVDDSTFNISYSSFSGFALQ